MFGRLCAFLGTPALSQDEPELAGIVSADDAVVARTRAAEAAGQVIDFASGALTEAEASARRLEEDEALARRLQAREDGTRGDAALAREI